MKTITTTSQDYIVGSKAALRRVALDEETVLPCRLRLGGMVITFNSRAELLQFAQIPRADWPAVTIDGKDKSNDTVN